MQTLKEKISEVHSGSSEECDKILAIFTAHLQSEEVVETASKDWLFDKRLDLLVENGIEEPVTWDSAKIALLQPALQAVADGLKD